jgi:hypothetical protein
MRFINRGNQHVMSLLLPIRISAAAKQVVLDYGGSTSS